MDWERRQLELLANDLLPHTFFFKARDGILCRVPHDLPILDLNVELFTLARHVSQSGLNGHHKRPLLQKLEEDGHAVVGIRAISYGDFHLGCCCVSNGENSQILNFQILYN